MTGVQTCALPILPADRLEAAIALGEALLAGEADLHALNRRSLAWRGKLRQTA